MWEAQVTVSGATPGGIESQLSKPEGASQPTASLYDLGWSSCLRCPAGVPALLEPWLPSVVNCGWDKEAK